MPKGETFYCFVYSQQSLNNEKIFSLYGNVEIRRQCFIFFYVNWINNYINPIVVTLLWQKRLLVREGILRKKPQQ